MKVSKRILSIVVVVLARIASTTGAEDTQEAQAIKSLARVVSDFSQLIATTIGDLNNMLGAYPKILVDTDEP